MISGIVLGAAIAFLLGERVDPRAYPRLTAASDQPDGSGQY
ncbi:hypothetical protein ABIB25_005390 [Nakamurella sp. UYEF19]